MGVRGLAVAIAVYAVSAGAQSFPDNPARELFQVICSACHMPSKVLDKHWSKAEWQAKVLEMLQEEPDVTQPERDQIVDYLAKSFPRKVNVNRAEAKQIEETLEVSAASAAAMVRYRQEKGDFKTLDDLKKVPGVDAAKLEANQNRIDY